MNRRLTILLSAYSCEPGKGSEPEVGWRWATSLAKDHDVTVVTRSNNEGPIRLGLADIPLPHPNFRFYDPPRAFLWLKKRGLPIAIFYLIWQAGVRLKLKSDLQKFDVIHHITFNSFRQPGFWWLCKRPVVLGPLGGGQICPWPFFPLMRGRRLSELLRSLSVIFSPVLPHVFLSFSAASRILVANKDTEDRILWPFRSKVQRMLETGVPKPAVEDAKQSRGSVQFLWLSWLIPIKAPELAIRAFASALEKNPEIKLTMAGDGPLRGQLERLAEELGVARAIQWPGRIPRDRIMHTMREHDVFIFTSLRDTSGNVLIEAMAAGLPAITLRHQGAAEIATDDTAIRILPCSIEQTVAELSDAMLQMAACPNRRLEMGKAAVARIADAFAWEKKAAQMGAVYRRVLEAV